MRILVAEDEPSAAEGLMRALRQAGYAVDGAVGGCKDRSVIRRHQLREQQVLARRQ